MQFRFEPIIPRHRITGAISRSRVGAALRDVGVAAMGRLTSYPTPPSPRYRRTGELGRRWTLRGPELRGEGLAVEVGTNLEYAPFVEGFKARDPKQTRVMARRGWPSVENVAREEWQRGRDSVVDALGGR